jgi:hypothetical protein
MPRISQFLGIVISMYYDDHAPPHFHVKYSEFMAKVNIETLETAEGKLPRRVMALVLEWAALHRSELWDDWDLAREGRTLLSIAPLE